MRERWPVPTRVNCSCNARRYSPCQCLRWIDDPKVLEAARRALIRAGYAASLLDEGEPE